MKILHHTLGEFKPTACWRATRRRCQPPPQRWTSSGGLIIQISRCLHLSFCISIESAKRQALVGWFNNWTDFFICHFVFTLNLPRVKYGWSAGQALVGWLNLPRENSGWRTLPALLWSCSWNSVLIFKRMVFLKLFDVTLQVGGVEGLFLKFFLPNASSKTFSCDPQVGGVESEPTPEYSEYLTAENQGRVRSDEIIFSF